jgi:hypothetical protein
MPRAQLMPRARPMPPAMEGGPPADPSRRLAALAIVAAFVLPAGVADHGPALCPVRAVTGFPCPACGLTRSWRAALHGDPAASLRFHPLGIVALLGAAAYATHLDERLDPAVRARTSAAWPGLVAAWLGTWLVRLALAASRGHAGVA